MHFSHHEYVRDNLPYVEVADAYLSEGNVVLWQTP